MAKINDYGENTTANESDVYIQETSNGTRKITFSTILNGIISKFLKSTQKSSLTATNKGTTSSREYAVGLDANGQMSVNVPWVDTNTVTPVVNNLTSTSTTSALSAAQGKYLQSEITDLNSALDNKLSSSEFIDNGTGNLPYTATKDCFFTVYFTTPSTGAYYLYLGVDGTSKFMRSGQAGAANYSDSIVGFLKKGQRLTNAQAGNVTSLVLKVMSINNTY